MKRQSYLAITGILAVLKRNEKKESIPTKSRARFLSKLANLLIEKKQRRFNNGQ